MQLVCGSDNALTGGSLLLSVYLYEQHIERRVKKRQVVGGGVLSIVAAHSLPPSSHSLYYITLRTEKRTNYQ